MRNEIGGHIPQEIAQAAAALTPVYQLTIFVQKVSSNVSIDILRYPEKIAS